MTLYHYMNRIFDNDYNRRSLRSTNATMESNSHSSSSSSNNNNNSSSSSRRGADRLRIAETRSTITNTSDTVLESTGRRSLRSTLDLSPNLSSNFNDNTSAVNARELRYSTRNSVHNADNNSGSNNNKAVSHHTNSLLSDGNASTMEGYNPNRRLDPDIKREMLRVISYADEIDVDKNLFADPVRLADAPGYLDIVKRPMDRSKIR